MVATSELGAIGLRVGCDRTTVAGPGLLGRVIGRLCYGDRLSCLAGIVSVDEKERHAD